MNESNRTDASIRPWTPEQIAERRNQHTGEALAGFADPYSLLGFVDPMRQYLDSLNSDVGRAGIRHSLQLVYKIATSVPLCLLDYTDDGETNEVGYVPAMFWIKFTAGQFAAIRARMIEDDYKPATVNHALSAVRGVINAMWQLGYITKEDAERLSSIKSVTNHTDEPAGREIALTEMRSILFHCELDVTDPVRGASAARDAAILSLLWSTGIRRNELSLLDVDAFDSGTGELHIFGKGNKPRVVFVAGGALEAMRAWLSVRTPTDGALFPVIDKWGNVGTRHMSPVAIYNAVKKRYTAAGVRALTPHDFRRTFVGNSLTSGVDILTVMGICGHSRVETTARYDRRKNEQKRGAAALVFTPYGA